MMKMTDDRHNPNNNVDLLSQNQKDQMSDKNNDNDNSGWCSWCKIK